MDVSCSWGFGRPGDYWLDWLFMLTVMGGISCRTGLSHMVGTTSSEGFIAFIFVLHRQHPVGRCGPSATHVAFELDTLVSCAKTA